MRTSIAIACTLALVTASMGCEDKKPLNPPKTPPVKTTPRLRPKEVAPKAPPKKAAPTKSTVQIEEPSADPPRLEKIGVEECDDYVAKFIACIQGKVPAKTRANLNKSITMVVANWKEKARAKDTRKELAKICREAYATAKQTMSAFECAW